GTEAHQPTNLFTDQNKRPRPESNGRPPPSQSGVLIPLNYEGKQTVSHSQRWIRTIVTRIRVSRAAAALSGIKRPFPEMDSNPHPPITAYRVEAGADTSAHHTNVGRTSLIPGRRG